MTHWVRISPSLLGEKFHDRIILLFVRSREDKVTNQLTFQRILWEPLSFSLHHSVEGEFYTAKENQALDCKVIQLRSQSVKLMNESSFSHHEERWRERESWNSPKWAFLWALIKGSDGLGNTYHDELNREEIKVRTKRDGWRKRRGREREREWAYLRFYGKIFWGKSTQKKERWEIMGNH